MHETPSPLAQPRLTRLLALAVAALIAACGGNEQTANAPLPEAAPLASGATTIELSLPELPEAAAMQIVTPLFHAAPGLLPEPDDADRVNGSASGNQPPRMHQLPGESRFLPTSQLTAQEIQDPQQALIERKALKDGTQDSTKLAPMAGSGAISTYSPAQIRAAYRLPALPAVGATPTAAQAAQLGAGQTIYIVNAYNNPNVVAELAAFNQKFGLPICTTRAIATTATLPLARAATSGCDFSVVYSTPAGGMTAAVPAYNAGWATETALDVQWAHATAPLARIVLIQAGDASVNSLVGAIKLANAMGPGIVSMSFGALEGTWTASVDSAFAAPNMTYLAATGDSGAAVSWPSVSPKVIAVGGTTLTYTGSGNRSEVVWSGTGGGISAYTATPSYQTSSVPGLGTVARRAVADVAFNADPASGQYVAVINPGSTTVNWMSVGGTSLSTPQWAGLMAMANAVRATVGKTALGAAHSVLYGQISTVPGTYASAFADITQASNGTCLLCTARAGYDVPTGLGTPHVTGLLTALAGTSVTTAPVVTAAAINGQVGTALSFTVSVTAPNPVTFTLTGAPAGLAIASTGIVSWATPVAGTYSLGVTARDTVTGLTGQGTYTVTISPPAAPVVGTGAISGTAGTALTFSTSVTAPNPVTYALTGAPTGMVISTAGVVSWPAPVAGTYRVTVAARDTRTGLTGQGVYTVAISAPLPPAVTAATVNGRPGTALSFTVSTTAPNPVTYTLSGAPAGMAISAAGVISWAAPVLGNYAVTVTARDTRTGLTGQGLMTVKIAVAGPVISAPAMTGIAGQPLTGYITITGSPSTSINVSISGLPLGVSLSVSGNAIRAYWASPVTGSYSVRVTAVDSAGLSAQTTVPITITAR
ncbi:MAG: putative Ig domain-containing protein [Burkholderiales bacterium]|nr:putative Ig domain-containing protein [Burkholderiales bacterium]